VSLSILFKGAESETEIDWWAREQWSPIFPGFSIGPRLPSDLRRTARCCACLVALDETGAEADTRR
jgi:hypothetical protein